MTKTKTTTYSKYSPGAGKFQQIIELLPIKYASFFAGILEHFRTDLNIA